MFVGYLSDLLKKEIGKIVKDYINEFLVEKVKDLLIGFNDFISGIVYFFGFNYFYYFSCMFKLKIGMIL